MIYFSISGERRRSAPLVSSRREGTKRKWTEKGDGNNVCLSIDTAAAAATIRPLKRSRSQRDRISFIRTVPVASLPPSTHSLLLSQKSVINRGRIFVGSYPPASQERETGAERSFIGDSLLLIPFDYLSLFFHPFFL